MEPMRRLSYSGSGQMVVEEVEPPTAPAGCVRIKVDSVGVCKSDVYGYGQINDRRDAVLADGETLVMGHEPSGIIDQLGPGVSGPDVERRSPSTRSSAAACAIAALRAWRTSVNDGSWSDAYRRRRAVSPI